MADDGTDVLDSWEELDDSRVLDKKLKEIKLSENLQEKPKAGNVVITEVNDRTQYQPQVRILKRQSDQGAPASTQENSKSNANKPVKTLEQREAEYAQARLRIMGATYDSENPDRLAAEGVNQNNSACMFTLGGLQKVQVMREPRGPDGSKGFDQPR